MPTPPFNASLLREKFVIRDITATDMDSGVPIIALSNRIAIPLGAGTKDEEYFVVRAQNMHCCARMAARLSQDHFENGLIMGRKVPFDWAEAWTTINKGYERKFNPQRWIAVYHKGRVVFEDHAESERHPFLDIIEQCDAVNPDSYDKSLSIAEDAFRQAGKFVQIQYDSNVALIMSVKHDEGKCGVIVRGPSRTTTFNFTAKMKAGRYVKPSQCLSAAAAFLEGIQLCFLIGMTNIKTTYDLIEPLSEEARKGRDAVQKLGRLKTAISQFEQLLDVSYRPDRPEFPRMIDDAETFARKVLAREIARKIEEEEQNGEKWIVE